MVDQHHMLTLGALGAGGLLAAAMAGWNQVKNIWSYISSFAFVSATIENQMSPHVRSYLYSQCRMVPSGLLFYTSRWFKLVGSKKESIVPFRVPFKNSGIFIHGFVPIFVSHTDGWLKLRSIRGLVDFDKLLAAAILQFEARNNTQSISRYCIYQIMGTDKSAHGMDLGLVQRKSNNNSVGEGASEYSTSDSGNELDHTVQTSFMYARDLYLPSAQDKDPLDGLFFDDHVLRYIDQAQQWLDKGDWYAERNIPWRRGWLLEGPGGTGKSSVAKATARKLGIPIYQYYLATLSDNEFIREWSSMQTPCIALLEDFDSVFNLRENVTVHKSLSFDTVLNTISGVNSHDGILLIVTTNHIEKIDPALGIPMGGSSVSTRPGRIDTVIQISYMSSANRQRMAEKMLRDWPDLISEVLAHTGPVTPAQFQEICLQAALKRMAEEDHSASLLRADWKVFEKPPVFVQSRQIGSHSMQ